MLEIFKNDLFGNFISLAIQRFLVYNTISYHASRSEYAENDSNPKEYPSRVRRDKLHIKVRKVGKRRDFQRSFEVKFWVE